MASKYEQITERYLNTLGEVATPEVWPSFLTTACHNFRLSFDKQVLLYAQRPDATAVLPIEGDHGWNKRFGRWVNRGSKGIAMFDSDRNGQATLKYYFDIADTHETRYSRPVPIWTVQPEYGQAIMETLENHFGELENKDSLASALISAAHNAVEDNMTDYLAELIYYKEDSYLEPLDDESIEATFKPLLQNSIAYMLMVRCGIDPAEYLQQDDFSYISGFNTLQTLNALGTATSDISQMCLSEIARTVLPLQRQEMQNRTFAQVQEDEYAITVNRETNAERSIDHDSDHIQQAGGLPVTEPSPAPGTDDPAWEVRIDAQPVSEGASESHIHESDDQRQAESASGGDRADRPDDAGADRSADGEGTGRDGGTESQRSDEVGADDEQPPAGSRGDGSGGSNLPLSAYGPKDSKVDYYHQDEEKNELLRTCDELKNHRIEIATFFADHPDREERGIFIRDFFDNYFVEKILSNGQRAGYRAFSNFLQMWRGAFATMEREALVSWWSVAAHIEGMILMGTWLAPDERPLPTVEEQQQMILEAHAKDGTGFTLPQAAIDYVITHGNGYENGKLNIYEFFQRGKTPKENIAFLKDAYGWGGHSDAIPGSGLWEGHDAKGIEISRSSFDEDHRAEILLKWPMVEKRIRELIAADRYLSPKEKERYPRYIRERQRNEERHKIVEEFRSIIYDHNDFWTQVGDKDKCFELYPLSECWSAFSLGKKTARIQNGDVFVLPAMRSAMEQVIAANAHHADRAKAMLEKLNGEIARPMEPTYDELNPPPPLPKEYRLSLGDTVYIGSQQYELLSLGDEEVTLFDPTFPLFHKSYPRQEFFDLLKENPLNDTHLQVITAVAQEEKAGESAPAKQQPVSEPPAAAMWEYSDVKQNHPDDIVLFQMGDFYEMYGEDAKKAAPILDLHLASRSIPGSGRVEMCGIPSHALNRYVKELRHHFSVTVSSGDWEKQGRTTITHPAYFQFGGYHFEAVGNLPAGYDLDHLMKHEIVSDPELGFSTYEGAKVAYSHKDFYDASGDSKADVFRCADNGKLYLPGENTLFLYSGEYRELELLPEQTPKEPTIQSVYEQNYPAVRDVVLADMAYRNACINSDEQKAQIECNAAISSAINTGDWDMNFRKLYYVSGIYHQKLHREIWEETYPILKQQRENQKTVARYDPKRFSVRAVPDTEDELAIWDAAQDSFYTEGGRIIRFHSQESADNNLSGLQNVDGMPPGGTLENVVFRSPGGKEYRIGDTFNSNISKVWKPGSVIDYVSNSYIWYTMPEEPEHPPIKLRRGHFELNLDSGDFYISTDQPQMQKDDPGRFSIRLLPMEGGIMGIWDSDLNRYYGEDGQLFRFAEQETAEDFLKRIQLQHGLEPDTVMTTPDGTAYRIGADFLAGDDESGRSVGIIQSIDPDDVWYTIMDLPEQEPIQMDRNEFERNIDLGNLVMAAPTFLHEIAEAERLIADFVHQEYGKDFKMEKSGRLIPVATALTEDDLHTFTVYADLESAAIVTKMDGVAVKTEVFPDLEAMLEQKLRHLELKELTEVDMSTVPMVGKIEYLATNGTVAYSAEFLEEQAFVNEIKDCNNSGVPIMVTLYRDRDGKTISTEFVNTLDSPLHGFTTTDSPYLSPASSLANREDNQIPDAHWQYAVGDTVYLDDIAFRIEQIRDTEVQLRDPTLVYPVYRAENRQRFEEMLALDERNGHFRDIPIQPTQALAPPAPKPKARTAATVLLPEIPRSQRHNYRITDDALGVGTPSQRYANNVAAIRLLKQLEQESRLATPEEQEVLSRYVGWGGLAACFEENHSKYLELKSLLSEEEYAAARESSLTAFYTPPVVIRAIYNAMERMNFQRGNILEPSCGVGNFLGMLPDSMKDSEIYGVELDSISGRIAQQLYQKSSIAVQGFEKTELPDSFFDAAIGNVPFGQFKVPDRQYDKHNFLIHDYFFARTLDKVRPGGIVAFITSKGTMDKENPSVRKYIAQRADLIGAIRLPNDTFKSAAGTDVTSDIIFLQKRDRMVDIEPDWVYLNMDENGLKMNQYFIDNPDMILGKMQEISGPFGPELACVPHDGQSLADLLSDAIQNIHAEVTAYEMDELTEDEEDKSIPALPTVRNFSYAVVEGTIYYRENSRMTPVNVSATAASRIKGLIAIRDCVRQLIDYQTEDFPDSFITSEQAKLNTLYDEFSKKYGLINSRANTSAFNADSSFCLLTSLEILDDEGNFVRKADMFSKRTIRQKVVVTSVDTASEALALSLAEKARIDMAYMEELTGKTEEQIYADLQGVIFLNPDYVAESNTRVKYLPADEYLSGNVREKLAQVKQLAELHPQDFASHVQALEAVQPKDLSASEISVRLGATWLPTDMVESFVYELFGTPRYAQWKIKIRYSTITGEWSVSEKNYDRSNVKAANTYGTNRINGYKIVEETLNLKDVRIFDYVYDDNGKKTPVLNKKETAIAQGKQEMIKQAFQDWVWKDPHRRERLCKLYNEKFNSIRPREYDGSHLKFVGMNPEITLRPHQVNAIAHILYGGNTLLAHVVGAGKTYEMVAAAMESKRLGLCQKSMFVVPNHLTEQWASEFLQLYPSANILVTTKKDFEAKRRKKFCGRIATGDYDAIIIGHSQFEKIPMSVGLQRQILQQQVNDILTGIAQAKADKAENFTIKQMEKTRKQIQAKLEKLNDQSRKDDLVTFEELGVDRIFVDEAHYYKNLAAYSKMRNVAGISQTEAQKSSDLYMKCRYLDEITDGRGIIFATGTPISNSMVEMFTLQRYLQYRLLEKYGLLQLDAWASTFGETVTAIELAPEGSGYRAKTRFARFYNLPELMAMFKEVADIQTADMLKLPVPKANFHNVVLQPSEQQKEMVASLSERAERVRNKMVNSSEDNMLLITNDGRKLALDQRLLNPLLGDSETSKVNACANTVYDIWQETMETSATQLVFCDLSTPSKVIEMEMQDGVAVMSQFQNVYDDLRKKLIAKGIPEEQIAFIHDANTETQKKELFGKVRSGQVRVLLGSTQKMGAGTNVQQKLRALHHIDCPWRPSDLQQREGRIVRQGNMHDEVDIYTYVTENTFDSYLYQLVESKQKFIGQIMTSKSPVRSAEDIDETALSYAEIKALCTGNPYIKEKMDLDIVVQRLRLLKSNHLSQRYALEDQIIKEFPKQIATLEQCIAGYQEDMAHLKEHTQPNEDGFSPMEINGVLYTDKKAAGNAILVACSAMKNPDAVPLGQYRGFSMELSFDSMRREFEITMKHQMRHSAFLGTDVFGNILRLDNALSSMHVYLENCQQQLENTKSQLANAKAAVDEPFPHEEELQAKSARLDELNILLNLDKKENEIVDGDLTDDEPPAPRTHDRER